MHFGSHKHRFLTHGIGFTPQLLQTLNETQEALIASKVYVHCAFFPPQSTELTKVYHRDACVLAISYPSSHKCWKFQTHTSQSLFLGDRLHMQEGEQSSSAEDTPSMYWHASAIVPSNRILASHLQSRLENLTARGRTRQRDIDRLDEKKSRRLKGGTEDVQTRTAFFPLMSFSPACNTRRYCTS